MYCGDCERIDSKKKKCRKFNKKLGYMKYGSKSLAYIAQMKLTKEQETKLTELAFAEKSNKEIAQIMGIDLADVHAARSRLGITIPKVKEIKAKNVQTTCRSKDEINQEIEKVQKGMVEAFKKIKRCNERIEQLYKELEAAK